MIVIETNMNLMYDYWVFNSVKIDSNTYSHVFIYLNSKYKQLIKLL